jgi:soluble lytic murein transglycosylase-like protein
MAATAFVFGTPEGGLYELAAGGRWDRVLEVASRRAEQLPLSQSEAILAAHAAHQLGEAEAEARFLALVSGDEDEIGRLARVRLGRLTLAADGDRAVELVLPAFPRTMPWPVREAATGVALAAVEGGVSAAGTSSLETAASQLSRSLRRRLEFALASADLENGRQRMERLMASSTRDLAALDAADQLARAPSLTPLEKWRVASTWYRHALYERAAPLFEDLAASPAAGVPNDEVHFLRGRCAFRQGQWDQAEEWYRGAVKLANRADRRADFEIHLARVFELRGELEPAVAAAIRAVRLKTTDQRRLFLARLRLRQGEPELAAKGISQVRSRASRARGEMMLAADDLRRGDGEGARAHLARVRGRAWSGAASVLAASLAVGGGRFEDGLAALDRAALSLDEFWTRQARQVVQSVPDEELAAWRQERRRELDESEGRARWRAYGRWASLENDSSVRQELRHEIESEFFSSWQDATPEFPPGLAADLWALGLHHEAARWDPSGFPRGEAAISAWSAWKFSQYQVPWRATRVADGAWRQAGSEVPTDVLPMDLQRALHPLPMAAMVREVASDAGIDWSLLAAVAREESRWQNEALSAVGARGLVQLMPATAAAVADRIGVPRPSADELFDPRTNLTLGGAELARLIEVFGGRVAPAVAAYNAGEHQARLWLDQCGPGCSDALYLVTISFSATRGYTAHVLASAATYAEIYDGVGAAGVDSRRSRSSGLSRRSGSLPAATLPVPATVRSPR